MTEIPPKTFKKNIKISPKAKKGLKDPQNLKKIIKIPLKPKYDRNTHEA